jgi:uncharacterized DUF497 family protein
VSDALSRLAECTGFQWDDGNSGKNWYKHQVSRTETEEVFFNRPIRVAQSNGRSLEEDRFAAFGQTSEGRLLTVVFTIRGDQIRVISARPMARKERRIYE